jgi:anti-sigma regulatory factor (Ser/Thr protein kinase)
MDDINSPGQQPSAVSRHFTPAESRPPAVSATYSPAATLARIPAFITDWRRGEDGVWPLQEFLELGALASAVPYARLHARQVLWKWGLTSLRESAELLVTELITNAVKASQTVAQVCPVRLWLLSDLTRILILVWDASPQLPVEINVGVDAENGRGLILVEAISERWGWYGCSDSDGKCIWALVRELLN